MAAFTSASLTAAGEEPTLPAGWVARYTAAAPATWGVAMLVPDRRLMAVSLVYQAEVMEEPGAKMSTPAAEQPASVMTQGGARNTM